MSPSNISMRKHRIQKGFSMVELMIAMTLSLILLAGVIQIFSSSKQTYRTQEENSRLQESGRTATTLLQRDIRPAGFQGCRAIGTIAPSVVANSPILAITANSVITGHEGSGANWTPSLPPNISTATSDTDAITVQRASDCGANLTTDMSATDSDIQINSPNSCNFAANQVMVISNCSSVDIFRATDTDDDGSTQTIEHDDTANGSENLSAIYNTDADVMGFSSFTYFIATGTDGQPSLWRFDNTNNPAASVNPMELVSNVADMQIEYGQDTDDDQTPNFYVSADNINALNWGTVISVKISLLVQTKSTTVATQAQTYTYNGNSVIAPDRRLYRVYTTTISLRNRVP